MKKLLIIGTASFALASCSSFKDKFNDVKLDIAKEGKEYTTKELKSEFAKVQDREALQGVSCESEAEKIGLRVEEKLISFLKAEQKEAAMINKSLSSAVLPAVCTFTVNVVMPQLIKGADTEYVCLREVGSDKLIEIGKDLCDRIK